MGGGKSLKIKNIFYTFSVMMLFFGMVYFISFDITEQPTQSVYTKISVITRETNSDCIVNLQQGIEQAELDLDVEISLVTLTEQNNAQEQQNLIQRELNSGAQAIVITPIDDEALSKTIEETAKKIPIIAMGSTIKNGISDSVLGQDEKMGQELGRRIFYKGIFDKKILILQSSQNCDAIQKREKGLHSVLEKRAESIVTKPVTLSADTSQYLETIIYETQPDIIVALEPTILDITAETIQNMQKKHIAIYGFGMTTKTPSYIEKNMITTAVIQNDFNLGYLSIRSAMQALGKIENKQQGEIDYALVNGYNMYTKENQRLLFPFVR